MPAPRRLGGSVVVVVVVLVVLVELVLDVLVELVEDVEVDVELLLLVEVVVVESSTCDAAGPAWPKPSPTRTNAVMTPMAPGKRLRTVYLHVFRPPAGMEGARG